MLVVPIVTPGNPQTKLARATAWLPEGEWVDFFTGYRYAGGQSIEVYRKLSDMPVFVRPGTIVPMDGAFAPKNGCPLPEALNIRVFTGASGEHVLIEDNGCRPGTDNYRRCETKIALEEGDGLRLTLSVDGDASLIPAGRRITIELVDVADMLPDEASCGVEAAYDADTRTLKLALDAPAGADIVLKWNAYPTCPALDRPALVHRMLLPIQMSNPVKDRMLEVAQVVDAPERRLAAWMCQPLPEGLIGALTELESVR